ncbi:pyridine nucleotide-disulfide oxidoreductase [Sinomonas atrocyanea]|uniref:Pyridine nucleotide-disulfide oxidoreductase n=1 Tax=Sinomonas atrocyanea TaxID=37927 RepID=A0A127A1H9_9MICC|nr:FAD-dependent oxidoreductase [Sinomonas atrocyanea]AMM33318.1 pyridine nucleotide-disulfide oxidoreductase [Sinomonas atrocyanea]GEB64943.1 pyridine nucleotide-disulfide oxidoreductase [Sinomonas atrocyanea]GGG78214.1 pyridine nucleotide-disulfide oxidoreductase [Sinomonas atrocyanea]
MEHPIVIAGGGLAAGSAAKTLREEGYRGPVQVVADERRAPYLRPPLSKEFLKGAGADADLEVNPPAWYDQNGVELLLGERAAQIIPDARMLRLENDALLPYSKLLIATGAQPRRLNVPGADLEGVHSLRRLEDSVALRSALSAGDRRVAVVGTGWIGLEVAAAAREYGNQVTVLGRHTTVLRQLEPALGDVFRRALEAEGVAFRLGCHPVEFVRAPQGDGVAAAVLNTGERIAAETVVVAVGVEPDTHLAEEARLPVRNGIVTDASLRTRIADVYAAGDVANSLQPFTGDHVRSEHWSNALNGGKVAARSMLGQEARLDLAPYFYTDQAGLSMEYSGYWQLVHGAELVLRGSIATAEAAREGFVALWVRDGALVGGMNVNVPRQQKAIKALIASRARLDQRRLADPSVPLAELAGL